MYSVSIGIDPGKSGGFAIIETDEVGCQRINVYPWDEAEFVYQMAGIVDHIERDVRVRTCLEKVGAMPGQGVTSMFNFGRSAGFIEGVLKAFKIPYQLIPPAKWKKEFSLDHSKQKSVEVAERLFQGISLMRTSKCRKPSDGMAEALLMAEYAERKL